MAEYIDREALIAKFKHMRLGEHGMIERLFADGVFAVIENLPAADVAPVRHGEWVMYETTYAGVSVANYKCSKCGESNGTWLRALPTDKMPRFCRWCGAKMDGGADE